MDFASITALFIGVALLAAKPGPGMLTVASKAISEGLHSVGFFMLGTNLIKILFFTIVVFGFHILPEDIMFFSILLKSLAAVYLIWLGIRGLKKFDLALPGDINRRSKTGFWENFSAGFMLTISNPFDILFFAGILPTLFDLQTIGNFNLVIAAFVIILADLVVVAVYALPLAMTRHFFSENLLKKVNIIASIGIIVVGLIIGYSALPAKDLLSVF
ncbi:MAG: LysE family translocator [Alphaproteobacteria bacterium]|nr:LysE family translocator [Alphaproteobacteria bacterium]